jgi:hypothetical protein
MKLIHGDYKFMTIGTGKRVHIGRPTKYPEGYAYALCSIRGEYRVVENPVCGDLCKNCCKHYEGKIEADE